MSFSSCPPLPPRALKLSPKGNSSPEVQETPSESEAPQLSAEGERLVDSSLFVSLTCHERQTAGDVHLVQRPHEAIGQAVVLQVGEVGVARIPRVVQRPDLENEETS